MEYRSKSSVVKRLRFNEISMFSWFLTSKVRRFLGSGPSSWYDVVGLVEY